ncbi:MAG: hypothetical protein H7138_00740 [Myxococcales bacterium]|nr:hypothetical protein [Myxococcales bacterium]
MARVDQRVDDVAGVSMGGSAAVGRGDDAREVTTGLSSFDGLGLGGRGEAVTEQQREDETRRGGGAVDAKVARGTEMVTHGGGMDVVPAWAMVVRDGPIPDVAPPPLTARVRDEAARATVETEAAGDGESDEALARRSERRRIG